MIFAALAKEFQCSHLDGVQEATPDLSQEPAHLQSAALTTSCSKIMLIALAGVASFWGQGDIRKERGREKNDLVPSAFLELSCTDRCYS